MRFRLTEPTIKVFLFFAFVILLLFKAASFHYFAFKSIPISSLWNDTAYFFLFYAQKISFTLFVGSFIFLFRKYWWTVGVLIFCDLWCISNLIYYKIFDSFLTIDTILMAGNMDGGWSSVLAYISYQDIVFIFSTVLFAILLFIVNKRSYKFKSHYILFVSVLACGIALNNYIHTTEIKMYSEKESELALEFERLQGKQHKIRQFMITSFPELDIFNSKWDTQHNNSWREQQVLHRSIFSFFLADLSYYASCKFKAHSSGKSLVLSQKEVDRRTEENKGIMIETPEMIEYDIFI